MIKFSLLCPSRGRLDEVSRLLDSIIKTTYNLNEIEILFAVDNDDPQTLNFLYELKNKNNQNQRNQKNLKNIKIFTRERSEYLNKDYYNWLVQFTSPDTKYLFAIGNDIVFKVQGWDISTEQKIEDYLNNRHGKKDRILCIGLKDNTQKPSDNPFPCFPIVTMEAYKFFGFILPPEIKTWDADIALYALYNNANRYLGINDQTYLEHSTHSDDIHKRIGEIHSKIKENETLRYFIDHILPEHNKKLKSLILYMNHPNQNHIQQMNPNQKAMNILITTCNDLNILPYSIYSTAINSIYATKWGYDHYISIPNQERAPQWCKVDTIKKFIHAYDYVFVIDADAYFQNHDIPLTSFLNEENKDKTFLMCENGPNGGELLNSGTFFIKNNERTDSLIDKWYNTGKEINKEWESFWEQTAFNHLYSTDPEFKKEVQTFPYKTFNSWFLDYKKPDQNQFIQHVMATSKEEKQLAISNFWESIKPKLQTTNQLQKTAKQFPTKVGHCPKCCRLIDLSNKAQKLEYLNALNYFVEKYNKENKYISMDQIQQMSLDEILELYAEGYKLQLKELDELKEIKTLMTRA